MILDTIDRVAMRRILFSRIITGTALAVYWVLLFVLTHVRFHQFPGMASSSDKVAHLVAYAGLGALAAWYLWVRGKLSWRIGFILMSILIAYAAVDELTQALLPYRTADILDWLCDVVGAGMGIATVGFVTGSIPALERA